MDANRAARIATAVALAKTEVLADIEAGRVPADVPTFAALHDHVDANEYGGLTDWPADGGEDDGMWSGDTVADMNRVQSAVDGWLRAGRRPAATLNTGELIALLAASGDPLRPVTITSGDWWLNVTGVEDDAEQPSLMLDTADNFDPRQF